MLSPSRPNAPSGTNSIVGSLLVSKIRRATARSRSLYTPLGALRIACNAPLTSPSCILVCRSASTATGRSTYDRSAAGFCKGSFGGSPCSRPTVPVLPSCANTDSRFCVVVLVTGSTDSRTSTSPLDFSPVRNALVSAWLSGTTNIFAPFICSWKLSSRYL